MSLSDQGYASSKVLRIEQRCEEVLRIVSTPMRDESARKHLNAAVHDILKITREVLDES